MLKRIFKGIPTYFKRKRQARRQQRQVREMLDMTTAFWRECEVGRTMEQLS